MSCTDILKRAELQVRTINIHDDLQHKKKTKENFQEVWKMIHSNCCLTVREGAEEAGISKTICYEIFTENLDMHHVAAKFKPHQLSEDQKQNHHIDVSKELGNLANADEKFLKNIVTGDDTWVYGYDIETKVQSSHWVLKTPPDPKKHCKFGPV